MDKQDPDSYVLAHIGKLVAEEDRLHSSGEMSDADRQRLVHIGVQLDQSWDLLRQRRARREFGGDVHDATLRPAEVVEKYQP
ncbi:DUF2630 family protein [Pseudolysobacter antarcticus]|uniref:DUF2630 family protein n=1 Tax=Pseudolysobacter antarcticus TaxID=2511995 RepID=A0A411HM99_9GAMM|nr:DUF2630 family protein [Pseudolysobacter antarcticus]QBB71646.1 DUF2630 family protein [Pseudolysobacter antarcticus]